MFTKTIKFFEDSVKNLKGKVTDTITADAKAEIEARIAAAQGVVDEMKKLEEDSTADAEDKSAEMQTQMKAILAKISDLEKQGGDTGAATEAANTLQRVDKIKNSKKFLNDFMGVVRNSETREEYSTNLRDMLSKKYEIKNTVTLADFLPGFLVNEINDMFVGKRHRLLELVDWTGLPCFKAFWETGNQVAAHYPLGSAAAKTLQTRAYTPVTIRPGLDYKFAQIDREMEKVSGYQDDVIVRYITKELLDRLLYTVESYICKGFTGTDSSVLFIAPTAATPAFDASNNLVINALQYLVNPDSAIAIMENSEYIKLKLTLRNLLQQSISEELLCGELGVDEIVRMQAGTLTRATDLLYMIPAEYKMVGDKRPDQFDDFNLSYNKHEYLMEMYVGGGSSIPGDFVVLDSTAVHV